jgi:DegV family protein with EDD domain
MKIVIDSGVDLCLPPEQMAGLDISIVPLTVSLEGKTYRGGLDISNDDFYGLLAATQAFPVTSQPSPGTIAEVYRKLAAADPEILSVHISSGLSGTLNAARLAVQLVPQARITLVDTKTLSVAAGWQAEAAARAVQQRWPVDKILTLVKKVSDSTDIIFTLNELRYLVHGGRISHIKGLLASLLKIKPLIGVEKERGTYVQQGQARNFEQAIQDLVKQVELHHSRGSTLRVQIAHARNPEGAKRLRQLMDERFKCVWLPVCSISLVLGAHTGPSVVGMAYAPAAVFADMP